MKKRKIINTVWLIFVIIMVISLIGLTIAPVLQF